MAAGQPSGDVMLVLTHPESYPEGDLERLISGLQEIALSTHESPRLRESATVALSLPGSRKRIHPVKGTLSRLQLIYKDANNQEVRSIAVSSMAGLAEETKTAAFLETLAQKGPGDPDYPRAVGWALHALPGVGEEGRAALKRLHESHAVRDPEAQAQLAELAKHGYRLGKSR
jgi:HEAT repeat protein